jgi:hypothetical protein
MTPEAVPELAAGARQLRAYPCRSRRRRPPLPPLCRGVLSHVSVDAHIPTQPESNAPIKLGPRLSPTQSIRSRDLPGSLLWLSVGCGCSAVCWAAPVTKAQCRCARRARSAVSTVACDGPATQSCAASETTALTASGVIGPNPGCGGLRAARVIERETGTRSSA